MELYFASLDNSDKNATGKNLISFSIPDIGLNFKAPFAAEEMALDYASLLTLLEFVDVNPQLFSNRALEVYCHNFDLVEQVEKKIVMDASLVPFLQKALAYRKKLNFSLNWVPRPDNPALNREID